MKEDLAQTARNSRSRFDTKSNDPTSYMVRRTTSPRLVIVLPEDVIRRTYLHEKGAPGELGLVREETAYRPAYTFSASLLKWERFVARELPGRSASRGLIIRVLILIDEAWDKWLRNHRISPDRWRSIVEDWGPFKGRCSADNEAAHGEAQAQVELLQKAAELPSMRRDSRVTTIEIITTRP